jgi:hypothetical protein
MRLGRGFAFHLSQRRDGWGTRNRRLRVEYDESEKQIPFGDDNQKSKSECGWVRGSYRKTKSRSSASRRMTRLEFARMTKLKFGKDDRVGVCEG